MGLKGVSVGVRFLLVLYIGKYFTVEDLGDYGIFNTIIMFGLILLGFNFYQYANRDLVNADDPEKLAIIRGQVVFTLGCYLIFLPVALLVFYLEKLPFNLMLVFYGVLILEHITQELFRLFIALGKSLISSVLAFLKSGSWVLTILAIWYLGDQQVLYHMDWVYTFWFGGDLLALAFGLFMLRRRFKGVESNPIDYEWVKKGIKISVFFLISTLAYKVIELSDRLMMDSLLDRTSVGVYTFYFQMSNIVHVVIFTAVLMIFYPKILKAIGNKEQLIKEKNQLSKQVYGISLVTAIVIYLLTPFVADFLGKDEITSYSGILLFLLIGNVLLNISFIYHYVLIAFKKDQMVMFITIAGAVVNVVANLVLIPRYGIYGAAFSSIAGFSIMFLVKTLLGHRILQRS